MHSNNHSAVATNATASGYELLQDKGDAFVEMIQTVYN